MSRDAKEFKAMLAIARGEKEPMTPEQYCGAIAAVGLNQERAGRFFGRAPRAGQRWALGETPIPFAVQWCLEYMVATKWTADPDADYMGPAAAQVDILIPDP
jgi:hypothetical protein